MIRLSISSLVLFVLCSLATVSLAIRTGDGNGGSRGNGSPGGRGGEGEAEAVNDAFEKLRVRLPPLQNEFCSLCALAGGGSEAFEAASAGGMAQGYLNIMAELQPKLVTISQSKYASSGMTRAAGSVECTNLLREYIQQFISRQIYSLQAGSENDILSDTDPYVRILALERYREYFNFDSRKEFSCRETFVQDENFPSSQA